MKIIKPKGTLIPIGGGNDDDEIIKRIIKETGKRKPIICYITVADSDKEEALRKHKKFSRQTGNKNICFIHFDHRSEADTRANIEKIKKCNAIFMGGGNQLRLSSLLGGTTLMTEIKKRYYDERHFVVAGSSAGAAAMSDTMIISGSSRDALVKGELQLTNGLDLINKVLIDTHFTDRGRFGRLIQTVAYNPGVLGLGLSIDTAAVIYNGDRMEVIGSGLAVIVDGTSIEFSDLTEVSDGDPLTIEGLKMHILGPGKCFYIDHRKINHVSSKPLKRNGKGSSKIVKRVN
jgi:cyanophycinase